MKSDEDIPEFVFEKPPKRERTLEKNIVAHAVNTGWEAYKTKCENRVGFPDRMFIKNARIVFMEIKKKVGGVRSPKQIEQIGILTDNEVEALFVDTLEQAVEILNFGD